MSRQTFLLLSVILVIITCGSTNGQTINPVGIGLRVNPDGGGADVKIYFSPHLSLDGQVNASEGFYYGPHNNQNYAHSFVAAGLLEYNIILPDPSWRFFAGAGIHAGSWDRYNSKSNEAAEPTQGIFGIDGIAGIEYMFKTIPWALSADVKPAMNVAVESAYFPDNVYGLTVRYYFGHKVPLMNLEKRNEVPLEQTGD